MSEVMKILIVEDNVLVRQASEYALKRAYNCEVLSASEVDTGLQLLANETPDVIILDYDLDDSNGEIKTGLNFLEGMKKFRFKVPTVIVSGQPNKSMAVELIKNGAIDYIYKEDEDFIAKMVDAVSTIVSIKQLNKDLEKNNVYLKKRIKQISIFSVIVVVALVLAFTLWG